MNTSYHRAIKMTPYEVVFHRKPKFIRIPVTMRDQQTLEDVLEQEIDDHVDDDLIDTGVAQQELENQAQESQLRLEQQARQEDQERQEDQARKDHELAIHLQQLEGQRLLNEPHRRRTLEATEDFEGFEGFEGFESSDTDGEGSKAISERPQTPPNLLANEGEDVIDPDLLSPHLQSLRIDQNLGNKETALRDPSPTTALRERARANQLQANKRSIKQYGKQRNIMTFSVGDTVSVAVPALDRASTDDKRIFGRVIKVYEDKDVYKIVTKYGILDRNYPVSELNPLPGTIDLAIPQLQPTNVVTLHHCAAQESTTDKVPVYCGCKELKAWCSTRRCACFKAGAKCSIDCHGGKNQDEIPDCPNISTMDKRTQKGHRQRDSRQEKQQEKRRRRDEAGRWIQSKGVAPKE